MYTDRKPDKEIDTRGEVCPFSWVKAKKVLNKLPRGSVLRIVGDHWPALKNIPHNFEDEGQTIQQTKQTGEITWEILVRREKWEPAMIDETIAYLIKAMNRFPFIKTLNCCGGHPEESAVQEYGYAVTNVVFEVKDEAENVIRWYSMIQNILLRRKQSILKYEHAFIFAKKFLLNDDGYLSWQWELKIQARGTTVEDCRASLDEGIVFLIACLNEVKKWRRTQW